MTGRSLVPDLPLFKEEADRAKAIFGKLRIPDVIGQPFMAQAAGPFIFDIVAALFGAFDVETNRRMINEIFLMMPKKNGKTTDASGIMLTALLMTVRPNSEYAFIAPSKGIADIAFGQTADMINADPALSKLFHHQAHIRRITHRLNDAVMQVKAADTDAVTGGKQVGTLIDETHEFARNSRAEKIFTEVRGALTSRPDGFVIQITTQSKDPPSGIFKRELSYARAVRDGEVTAPFLPVLYELPEEVSKNGGWKNKAFWHLVNPNFGRSVDSIYLATQLEKAEREGGLAIFASQHFNVEIGTALRMDAWAGARYWDAQGDRLLTFDLLKARCDVVVAGIDGGGLDDLLSLAVIGRDRQTRQWLHWQKSWVHVSGLQQRVSEISTYLDFVRDGDLWIMAEDADEITRVTSAANEDGKPPLPVPAELIRIGGMTAAFADLAEICFGLYEDGLLAHIGMDPAGVGLIVEALADKGLSTELPFLQGVSQGWQLQGAIKSLEVKCASREFIHGKRPLMAWAVGNAKTEMRGSALMITKQVSGTAKIDPLMATFDAAALMAKNPEPPAPPNAWEADEHTLLVL